MGPLFYDRLTGSCTSQIDGRQTITGRWQIVIPPGESAYLNSVPVQSGTFLVPELSNNWRLLQADGTSIQGIVSASQQPEDIEADSIRTIGEHLASIVEIGSSWLDWLEVVPLAPGMSERVNLLPFDKIILDLFKHLRAVCMRPCAHLHVEVERVLVAKARRLPTNAASYLASHTEDWERPLLRGVLPKRILAEVRDDLIDIYENRVAARLVDHLSSYLTKRIREIRKLLRMFQDKEDYSEAVGGTYLRQRRILKLWDQWMRTFVDANISEGTSVGSKNPIQKKAEVTLQILEGLKFRVMGLMDSPLYREIPRLAYVAPTLRTTNILSNDQNYRRVAKLWRECVRAGLANTKSPGDVYREAQDLCHGMDHFSMLLVIRALDQLGYEVSEKHWDEPICAPGSWVLEAHGERIECAWRNDGSILIEKGDKSLHFVSIPMDFTKASNEEQIRAVVDRVSEIAENAERSTIILYAGSSSAKRETISDGLLRCFHTVGNDPQIRMPASIGFLSISPWDICSIERVTRSLRWFLDSARFDAYPVTIDLELEARYLWDANTFKDWITVSKDRSKLIMSRVPRSYEWAQLRLDDLVNEAEERHQTAINRHALLTEELREAVRKGKTGTLNQQKKKAHQQCVELEKQLAAIIKMRDDLIKAHERSEALLKCPACRVDADPIDDFEQREKGGFLCNCQRCHAQWGTRLCKRGHKYAIMLPGGFVDTDDYSAGCEDRTYGSDLLALPGRTPNGEHGFVCPICGEIT